jgi:hypothetical protein
MQNLRFFSQKKIEIKKSLHVYLFFHSINTTDDILTLYKERRYFNLVCYTKHIIFSAF